MSSHRVILPVAFVLLLTATACSQAFAQGGTGGTTGQVNEPTTEPETVSSPVSFPDQASQTGEHVDAEPVDITNARKHLGLVDGTEVADFQVETYAHGRFRLSDFAGQPVVINFWFPSCPQCKYEKPIIRAAEAEWREQGVVFLGAQLIGIDTSEDGIEFLEENGLVYRNFADHGPVARSFGIFGYPSTVVLDGSHRVSSELVGAVTRSELDYAVRQAMETEPGS